MTSVGSLLKKARLKKKLSREGLARATKIKIEFIEAVETETWQFLPEFPVVYGFVRNLASFLKIDEKHALALLKRDYPPKVLPISPKPEIAQKFVWGPKATFLTGVVLVSLMIFGYLGFQYFKFTSPPPLSLEIPVENQETSERSLKVKGATDPEVVVRVNNQPALVKENGEFETEIEIFEGTTEVEVKAVSRSGKETVVIRRIKVDLENK